MIRLDEFRDAVKSAVAEAFPSVTATAEYWPTVDGREYVVSVQPYGDAAANAGRATAAHGQPPVSRVIKLRLAVTRRLDGTEADAVIDAGVTLAGDIQAFLLNARIRGFWCPGVQFEEPMVREREYSSKKMALWIPMVAEFRAVERP